MTSSDFASNQNSDPGPSGVAHPGPPIGGADTPTHERRRRFDERRRLALQSRSERISDECRAVQKQWSDAHAALAIAKAALEKWRAEEGRTSGYRGAVSAERARAERDADDAQLQHEHLHSEREAIAARSQLAASHHSGIMLFLRGEPVYGEPVHLKGGSVSAKSEADLKRQLERVRAEIAGTIANAAAINAAPLPEAEALERFERALEHEARWVRGHSASRFTDPGDRHPVGLGLEVPILAANGPALSRVTMEPALAALFPEVLRSHFTAWIRDHLRHHAPGLPFAERGPELAKLAGRRDELERREEALCRLAEREGWRNVERRVDVRGELLVAWDDDESVG